MSATGEQSRSDKLVIRVAELRWVCNLLLDHLREIGYDTIEIADDHYWAVPLEELHNLETKLEGLALGEVSEAWDSLQRLLRDEEEPPLVTDMHVLADILRVIGAQSEKESPGANS